MSLPSRWLVLAWVATVVVTDSLHAGDANVAKPVNLEKVNTDADEDDPHVNGDFLWYASNKAGTFDLLLSRRTGGTWVAGKPVFNDTDADERSPFYFAKLNTLYFATNKVPDDFKKDQNFDIKSREAERQPLPLLGITEKTDELHPWVAAGGKEFYFSRKVDKDWVLFVANGPATPPIGKAKEVGFPPGFHHATLTGSGLLMYLQGPLENERWGIFRSKRAKVGAKWSMPEPLTALNHPKGKRGDMSPCVTADNARLYYVSDRPGGKGGLDIWSVATAQLK